MIELTRDEKDVLLLHIVRCPDIFDEFIDKTRSTTFDKVLDTAHDFIAQVLVDCDAEYGGYPGLAAVEMKFRSALSTASWLPQDAVDNTSAVFDFLTGVPEDMLCPDAARVILARLVERQTAEAARDRIVKALERGTPLSVVLTDINADAERRRLDRMSGAKVARPFEDPAAFMVKSEVFPTGVDLFDAPLAGGFERHDLIGVLAPSGGGKTTLAVQLATSWIRQGPDRVCLLCSYEQPIEGDIMVRALVNMTGMRSSVFRGKPMSDLPDHVREAVSAALDPLKSRFNVADLSTNQCGMRGVDDIAALHDEVAREDGPPVLVILDWFLPCVQRAMAGSGENSSDSSSLRLFGSRFMDRLKVWKNSHNVALVITHQINCEAGNASANRKPQWGDAAEWKGFAWFPNVCFGVGVLAENIGWFCSTKVRCHAKAERLVRLQGELCRFSDVTRDYMLSPGGKFVPKIPQPGENCPEGPETAGVGGLRGDVTSQFI